MAKPLLEATDLGVRYGQATALDGVGLSLGPGERVIMLGRNGAGKTTLLNVLSGIVPAARGTVTFAGEPLLGRPAHAIVRGGLAHVCEGRRVFPTMSVRDNLFSGGGWIARHRRAELHDQAMDLFPRLRERYRQAAGTLSGGERQMLLIARGLMLDPKVLLLDEASQGLAPVVVDEVLAAVERISELGVAALVVEQNTRVLGLSGRVIIMSTGRLIFSGHSGDPGILDQVRQAYLDDAPAGPAGAAS
ncbi:ABC transporter ATP-binding protein [Sphaerisporangium rufum]|uniref:ABC transporter ATP-binding protein n=1 Tax=Sphaerisporangium rufum TaxID=1381558 RepID=A0A919R2P7_9ACTN|nr:ABC transporter ATP-binding protein [Sphaerisporangium rufum]GII75995.1 ABC transporter ATP-binding protein [Sphaerisporangium rufum]